MQKLLIAKYTNLQNIPNTENTTSSWPSLCRKECREAPLMESGAEPHSPSLWVWSRPDFSSFPARRARSSFSQGISC